MFTLIVTVLEEAGEIEHAPAERLRGWAGFRNELVHEYVDVDHRIAYRALHEDLGDLAESKGWAVGRLDPPERGKRVQFAGVPR